MGVRGAVDGDGDLHCDSSVLLDGRSGFQRRGHERAAGEDLHHVALPFGRAADVVARLGGRAAASRSGKANRSSLGRFPTRTFSAAVTLVLTGLTAVSAMPARDDRAVAVELEVGGDADGGVVADLALELLVGAAGAARPAPGSVPR